MASVANSSLHEGPNTEVDMTRLVARHRGEACVETGEDSELSDDPQQELLPRQREHPFDNQVVGRNALDPGSVVLRGLANRLCRIDEIVIEDRAKAAHSPIPQHGERFGQPTGYADHLIEESREEHRVPGLVDEL